MYITKAISADCNTVKHIAEATIQAIYPHYYPKGAVDYFISHHSISNISNDILMGVVYLCYNDSIAVGTVTVKGNEICRLFVLPEYQGNGYGNALLDFAENQIFLSSDSMTLSSSLPAKALYRKRGYTETYFNSIRTDNGDYLCFDTMVKTIDRKG